MSLHHPEAAAAAAGGRGAAGGAGSGGLAAGSVPARGRCCPGAQCPFRGLPGPAVSPLPSSLLPEARHLQIPQPAQGFALLQEPGVTPECGEGEEDEPVVRGAPGRGF
ncbi:Transmembrane protease serine 5 [Aix galericulata]|nr:Transmembrane protease serine 5 [Aix galericulata]